MRRLLSKIWSFWKRLALAVARVNTEIIVFLFYFVIFMPFGFILRLLGHDPLRRRLRESSNWQKVNIGRFDWKRASHQS
jgi:hypothetical protein